MTAKKIVFQDDARLAIARGVRRLTRAVAGTLGPRGLNVVIEKKFGSPTVTREGVQVAKEIVLEDALENAGVEMVRQVASKTSDAAGDGTTTATILAEAIFSEGLKNVTAGADPMSLKRGVERAVQAISEKLTAMSTPISDRRKIAQVATIAANNDAEIGEKLADAMERVGKDGVITVEEGKSLDTTVELVDGMQFDRGYISPYFMTDAEKQVCELDDCYVLVHEKKIGSLKDLLPLLESLVNAGRPLLIVAEDVEGEALATLVVNRLRGTLRVAAVKAPGYGDRRKEMLADIAILVGARAITEDVGIELANATLEDLGCAKKVLIDKDTTTIVEGTGSAETIKGRIAQIRQEIEGTTSDYDREKLQERLAKLAGGVAKINVGAATEIEMKERKARVEGGLHATRAAIEEGILPGGGVALLRARSVLDDVEAEGDERVGVDIVRRALTGPIRQIAENAGADGSIVVDRVLRKDDVGYGFDARTLAYGDLVEHGVIDPTKVVRSALENAASVATLLLTTECAICKETEEGEDGEDDLDY
ncbi:chaperonin GroEL [Planctomycetota bacterium]